jgi:hypothetical protein
LSSWLAAGRCTPAGETTRIGRSGAGRHLAGVTASTEASKKSMI